MNGLNKNTFLLFVTMSGAACVLQRSYCDGLHVAAEALCIVAGTRFALTI